MLSQPQPNQVRQQLEEERAINIALARAQTAEHHGRDEKFDGKKERLRPFLAQLRIKAATYSNEQARLRLAFNSLTGEASDLVMPQLYPEWPH